MVTQQAQRAGQKSDEWSAEELMVMSDIVKDMSEVYKNIAKVHYMSSHNTTSMFKKY